MHATAVASSTAVTSSPLVVRRKVICSRPLGQEQVAEAGREQYREDPRELIASLVTSLL
jgi:hypothetical protein